MEGETAAPLGLAEVERSRDAAIRYGMDVRWPLPAARQPEPATGG